MMILEIWKFLQLIFLEIIVYIMILFLWSSLSLRFRLWKISYLLHKFQKLFCFCVCRFCETSWNPEMIWFIGLRRSFFLNWEIYKFLGRTRNNKIVTIELIIKISSSLCVWWSCTVILFYLINWSIVLRLRKLTKFWRLFLWMRKFKNVLKL